MSREPIPFPTGVRGLQREQAARYTGLSATRFDELVDDGRMPKLKRVDARKVWHRQAVDIAFEALPDDGAGAENPWDEVA